jgi:hypothetical protein
MFFKSLIKKKTDFFSALKILTGECDFLPKICLYFILCQERTQHWIIPTSMESAKYEGKIVEQMYVSLIYSRMLLVMEIWGLEEEWMIVWIVHETFCQRAVGVLGTAVSGALLDLKITDHRKFVGKWTGK